MEGYNAVYTDNGYACEKLWAVRGPDGFTMLGSVKHFRANALGYCVRLLGRTWKQLYGKGYRSARVLRTIKVLS